jgi:thymidylate synthase (FAD)
MKVVVISQTENPEYTCAKSMRSTRTITPAYDFTLGKEDVIRLLRMARTEKHFGVFEHAYFTVSVSGISRVCTHQLVRHRLFAFMQTSGRVIDPKQNVFVIPASITALTVSGTNKELYDEVVTTLSASRALTVKLEEAGVPREDARYLMPEATAQNIVISGNARQWMHFFWMRCSEGSHAQWEIRRLAEVIFGELRHIAPIMFEELFEC